MHLRIADQLYALRHKMLVKARELQARAADFSRAEHDAPVSGFQDFQFKVLRNFLHTQAHRLPFHPSPPFQPWRFAGRIT